MGPKKISFYVFYLLTAFIVIAVIRFPGEQAGQKVSNTISRIFPSMGLAMEKTTLDFPLGIELQRPVFSYNESISIPMDRLNIHFSIWDILRHNQRIGFSAGFLKGNLTGELENYSPVKGGDTKIAINLAGAKLENISYGVPNAVMDISMEMSGHYSGLQSGAQSKAKGGLTLSQVVVKMGDSVFNSMGIDSVSFSRIDIEYSLFGKTISITECTAAGKIMSLKLHGSLMAIAFPLESTGDLILDLEGFLQPQPAYFAKLASLPSMSVLFKDSQNKGIAIRITGPLNAPEVEL